MVLLFVNIQINMINNILIWFYSRVVCHTALSTEVDHRPDVVEDVAAHVVVVRQRGEEEEGVEEEVVEEEGVVEEPTRECQLSRTMSE